MTQSLSKRPVQCWPVMLTAFTPDGAIDWNGVDALVEWYLDARVHGLFAVCLSSEMYELDEDERLSLSRHVVKRVAGRVPVIASGTFGGPIGSQAAFSRRMADTGVAAVVVISSNLGGRDESDDAWRGQMESLLEQTGNIQLGIYECPVPYKRLLTPEILGWLDASGRVRFMKDTCCDMKSMRARRDAVRSGPMQLLNANTPTLLESIQAGYDGFSGIGANFHPQLYTWLCENAFECPEEAEMIQRVLSVADMAFRNCYPTSAKQYLSDLGLPISTACRVAVRPLSQEERYVYRRLKSMVESVTEWIDSPAIRHTSRGACRLKP